MEEIIKNLKDFEKENYKSYIENRINSKLLKWKLKPIYTKSWEEDSTLFPYEAGTHLMDSYSFLPERPDLAFTLCWQSINNLYNEMQLKDSTTSNITDKNGLDLLMKEISNSYSKYEAILLPLYANLPLKSCKFVATYILKDQAIKNNINIADKFVSQQFKTFKKGNEKLEKRINNTYGEKYNLITNLSENSGKISFGIQDGEQSKKLTHSLGLKLQNLVKGQEVTFSKPDEGGNVKYKMTNEEKVLFLIKSILYSSRGRNTHGKVASRMGSMNSNNETYLSYKYVYLLAHTILLISLNILGYITDLEMNSLNNENVAILK